MPPTSPGTSLSIAQPSTDAVRAADSGVNTLWPIEGLRGLAALMVMWCHYRHLVFSERAIDAFVYTGVDFFFVLSGFVFAPYVFGRPLRLVPYLVRRVLRIYPLYVATLLIYAWLRHIQGADAWRYIWPHLAMLHTSISQEMAAYYNGAFWSLPVELEFYALVPLIAALVARNRRWFAVAMVFALLVHFALARWAVLGDAPLPWVVANVHWPGLWGEFLLGCLAWRAGHWPAVRRAAPWLLLLAAGLWLAAATIWTVVGDSGVQASNWLRGNMGPAAAGAYALALAVLAARMRQGGATAGAAPKAMRFWAWLALIAGQLSYGIYLLHNAGQELAAYWWPGLLGWQRLLVATILTFSAAWVLHYAVEAPARNWGKLLSSRWSRARPGGLLQGASERG